MAEEKLVKIRLIKSLIGIPEKHRRIVRSLGLRKISSTVIQKHNPQIQGMIYKVRHLVRAERVKK